MPGITGKTPGNGTSTLSYTIPGAGLDLESVYAVIDASAATTDVTAELTIADQSGVVIAKRTQAVTVPAADTGSATWALRLDDDNAAAALVGALELAAYGQKTSDANVPGSVLTTGSFSVRSITEVYLAQFYCPNLYQQGNGVVQIHSFLSGVEQALIAISGIVGVTEFQLPMQGWLRYTGLTPGSYTLSVSSTLSGAGPAVLKASTGGAGDLGATFAAVYRVVG
jgi:hypothetical protein